MNYMTKRCYALALKQLRTGLINEEMFLELKEINEKFIKVISNPSEEDRDFLLSQFFDSIMFESPSQALINID